MLGLAPEALLSGWNNALVQLHIGGSSANSALWVTGGMILIVAHSVPVCPAAVMHIVIPAILKVVNVTARIIQQDQIVSGVRMDTMVTLQSVALMPVRHVHVQVVQAVPWCRKLEISCAQTALWGPLVKDANFAMMDTMVTP